MIWGSSLGRTLVALAAGAAAVLAALRAAGRRGAALERAARDRAALDTIRRVQDAQDLHRAGDGGWHERLRRSRPD